MALLGPRVRTDILRRFELPGVEVLAAESVALEPRPSAALVIGGDGTVHRCLAPLIENGIPFLPVPCGSGNDFAISVGLRSVPDAIAAWTRFVASRDNVMNVDAGLITPQPAGEPSYFCCVAGAGFDSDVNRRANSQPAWLRGNGGYILAVLASLCFYRPRRIRVMLSSSGATGAGWATELDEPALMVAVGNAPQYGAGMRIAHRAVMDDGLLDICFVRHLGKLKILRFFPRLFRGGHLGMKEVEYRQAERLRIEGEESLAVYADGEYVCSLPVEVTILRHALKVIAP